MKASELRPDPEYLLKLLAHIVNHAQYSSAHVGFAKVPTYLLDEPKRILESQQPAPLQLREVGKGWRLLDKDELVEEGDECQDEIGGWMQAVNWITASRRQGPNLAYRRKIAEPSDDDDDFVAIGCIDYAGKFQARSKKEVKPDHALGGGGGAMSERQEPTPRQMIAELLAAGWKRLAFTQFKSPDGGVYYGPYQAWVIMKARQPTSETNRE